MTFEPAPYQENRQVVNFEDSAMSVESVVRQVKLIQDVMAKVMREGEHYGIIPGCKKPSLYKPGAEKLCMTFRLSEDYQVIREIQQAQIISYTVRCVLTHIPTGQVIASGIGACNSREEKYRWEYKLTPTETPIPPEYWAAKKADNNKEMKRILGEGRRPMKIEETGQWVVAHAEKVENENAWDYDNTIIKMACKRALIAAILNGTAASDIFAQDIEDNDGRRQEAEAAKENGIREPGKKATETKAQTDALQTVVTAIKDTDIKTGDKKDKAGKATGEKWTLYIIKGEDGGEYKTFSESYKKMADDAVPTGKKLKIIFKTEKNGNLITGMDEAEG